MRTGRNRALARGWERLRDLDRRSNLTPWPTVVAVIVFYWVVAPGVHFAHGKLLPADKWVLLLTPLFATTFVILSIRQMHAARKGQQFPSLGGYLVWMLVMAWLGLTSSCSLQVWRQNDPTPKNKVLPPLVAPQQFVRDYVRLARSME